MPTKDVLTTFEAAKMCRVSYNTIKNWIKRGLLDAYRTVGGHLRIKLGNLEVFCREHGIPLDKQVAATKRKVLIVDDEERIQVALKEMLSDYPETFDIATASDGFEAGLFMQSTKPDLVILDLVMPGMDGFKVCRLIRQSSALKHARIIALAAVPSDRNLERITELGADLCLAKPIDKNLFFESIRTILTPKRGVRSRGRKPAGRNK